jgi:hypothetical protein
MRIVLSKEQIRALIQKSAHESLLKEARENENLLQQFYDNSHPELVFNEVKPLLTGQKFNKFKVVYKNHAQTLVDRIKKHYQRVFTSSGKSMTYDFGMNEDIRSAFLIEKQTMFEGTSDGEYFSETGSKLALTQPNSIYVVGSGEDENGELKIKVKHIPLDSIHDIKASIKGIRYCIIKQKVSGEKGVNFRFWVYDDVFFSVWIEGANGITIDPAFGTEMIPHNNSVCPATWVYDDNMTTTENVSKKSVYNDSTKDLMEYNIIKTFYQNYRYFGAFGKEVMPETRCSFKDTGANVKCNGTGTLSQIDPGLAFQFPLKTSDCPSCKNKNSGVMGEIFKIPIQQQGNVELMNNYSKLNFRIDADSKILEFHKSDISEFKQSILVDSIGDGYGDTYVNQAINQDQVASNFDTQETNLNYFKHRIEKPWQFCLERAAEIFAPESFERIIIKLGNKYFLKTIAQLYDELVLLYKGTNNSALIEQKQFEILMTENKNDIQTIKRFELVRVLKPFSSFPLEYITDNRQALQQSQPTAIAMFDNFDQVLAIWEIENGKIESMIMDEVNTGLLIKKLIAKFKEILTKINPIQDVPDTTNTTGES